MPCFCEDSLCAACHFTRKKGDAFLQLYNTALLRDKESGFNVYTPEYINVDWLLQIHRGVCSFCFGSTNMMLDGNLDIIRTDPNLPYLKSNTSLCCRKCFISKVGTASVPCTQHGGVDNRYHHGNCQSPPPRSKGHKSAFGTH